MTELSVTTTDIPGLLVVTLPVHGDARGWFKENWQREKMTALGLPDFGPVQNNMSFNAARGATRGIHTEPWDKFVSVATGRVFAAWVDMREGDSFGATFSIEIGPDVAVFVPRGVGNSYQALEDGTVYSYLVNDHFVAGKVYPALNLADETAAIAWPIPLDSDEVEISEKDLGNPRLAEGVPMKPTKTLIVGANGQLGRALAGVVPAAERVDLAETAEGRVTSWAANATAPALLAKAATEHRLTLVHVSSDYVFDGTSESHPEDEPLAPLGVYGQSKAAGDLAVGTARRHYLVRTSWVIGDGKNFVLTMRSLAENGVSPSVVDDQIGRLTFTTTLAEAIAHLVRTEAAYGTYDVTNDGAPLSWQQIAAEVFALSGRDRADVAGTSTQEYFASALAAGKPISPRPLNSVLRLDKVKATGFVPSDQLEALRAYLG